MTVEQFD